MGSSVQLFLDNRLSKNKYSDMRLMNRFFKAKEEVVKVCAAETVIVAWSADTAVSIVQPHERIP
jgi:hypothetical protein